MVTAVSEFCEKTEVFYTPYNQEQVDIPTVIPIYH